MVSVGSYGPALKKDSDPTFAYGNVERKRGDTSHRAAKASHDAMQQVKQMLHVVEDLKKLWLGGKRLSYRKCVQGDTY